MMFAFYLVPCSLIVVWYLPYYLYFSKTFYSGIESNDNSTDNSYKESLQKTFYSKKNPIRYYFNLILPVRTLYDDKGNVMDYLDDYNSDKQKPK